MKNDLKLQNLKGTVDYLPKEQILREQIFSTLKGVFEKYGFLPLDTAILCPFELLSSKYAGGAEILKEVYRLKDQGERDLGLRYDLTVPFSKTIAANQNISLPFRRYEIGKVFRNGPVKLGRMREFYQCDVDVCGIEGRFIEVEFFQMALEGYNALGLDVEVKWNNRKYLSGLIEESGISTEITSKSILALDKLEKVGEKEVEKELLELGCSKESAQKLFSLLSLPLNEVEKVATSNLLKEGIYEVQEIQKLISELNLKDCVFSSTLARGLEIYTGTVWEIFDKTGKVKSSLGGGGRYDKIIGKFIDNGLEYPALGMSFGIEPIYVLLEEKQPEFNRVDLFIYAFELNSKILEIASALRKEGVNVIVDYKNKKLKKALEQANSLKIPFVAIIGEDEIKENEIALKNMKEGTQVSLSILEAAKLIIKERKNG